MAAYPRKQTVFIFIICALVTGGTAFYVHDQNGGTTSAALFQNAAAIAPSQSATGTIATDVDWRKEFLASTSGAFNTAAAKTAVVPAKQAPLTQTDLLGRDFLAKYGELKQAGLTDDSDAVTNAMSEVVSENAASLSSPKIYSGTDIRIVANSDQAMSSYKAAVQAVALQYSKHQDEAAIAGDALESGDTDSLAKIDTSVSDYKSMISRLLAVSVPQTLAQNHLDLLNGLSSLLYSAQAFRHIDTNPLQGFAAIKMNGLGSQQAEAAFLNI